MDASQHFSTRSPLPQPASDDCPLWDLLASEQYVLWLAAADDLGLFATLENSPTTAQQLAERHHIGLKTAEGLLGVLAALGFLVHHEGAFSLAEVARTFLLPTSVFYRGAWLEAVRRRPRLTYSSVQESIRRDLPIPLLEEGVGYWDKRGQDAGRRFAEAMHTLSFAAAPSLAKHGAFAGGRRLLDVGGGSGGMSIGIALQYADVRCTILDRAPACAFAEECIAQFGVQHQVDTVIGDALLDTWPSGYDAILFSNFLNSVDAPQCSELITMASRYLPIGGHLYIHEMLLRDSKDGPLGVIALSLYDHLLGHCSQFSSQELTIMVTECGFADVEVTSTYSYYSLLSATKA